MKSTIRKVHVSDNQGAYEGYVDMETTGEGPCHVRFEIRPIDQRIHVRPDRVLTRDELVVINNEIAGAGELHGVDIASFESTVHNPPV